MPWIALVSVKVAYFLEGKGKRQLTRGCAPCAVAPGRMASSTLPLPSKVTVSRNRPTEIDLMLMGRFQTCNYSFAGLCGKHSLGCGGGHLGGGVGDDVRRRVSATLCAPAAAQRIVRIAVMLITTGPKKRSDRNNNLRGEEGGK